MGGDVTDGEVTEEWTGPRHVVLERIGHAPRCAALLDIWKAARVGNAMAARSALDPIILAKAGLLPFVWVLERDAGGACFYRLIGESIRRNFNMPMRGRYVHEIFDQDMSRLISSRCERILSEAEIMFTSGRVYRDGKAVYYARRLVLPLRDEDGTARFLIGTVDQSEMGRDTNRVDNPRFTNDFVAFVGVESI